MTNVAEGRPPSERRALLWWLAGLFALIGLALTLLIAVPAVTRPDWAITPGIGTEWWQAGPDDDLFLVAILIAFALAMRFFASARGGAGSWNGNGWCCWPSSTLVLVQRPTRRAGVIRPGRP